MSIHICDLAWLHENNEVTYDLVILGISKPQGLYYVKTVTLDGKSDLKTRTISPQSSSLTQDLLHQIKGLTPTNNSRIVKNRHKLEGT